MNKLSSVSIILPIRNEATYIERSLHAILRQDYPHELIEILVTDGMSTDNSRSLTHDFSTSHPQLRIKVLDNPGKIVPTGINIALQKAKGEVIIRVDGHCVIASDYVSRCVEHIQQYGVDGVGGSMETVGETLISKIIAIGMSSQFGVGNSAFRTINGKSMLVDTVPFPAYTRKVIDHVGLYDEELVRNQDDEYNYRIRELGGRILLADDVRSTYFSRSSFKHLWRQYFQYGFWKVRVLQKHPRQMSLRQFVPPLFVTSLFLSMFFLFLPSPFFLHPSFWVFLVYGVVNLLVSFGISIKHGLKYIFLLSVVFGTLHISYGLGFLIGLFKFWNRWGDRIGTVPAWRQNN